MTSLHPSYSQENTYGSDQRSWKQVSGTAARRLRVHEPRTHDQRLHHKSPPSAAANSLYITSHHHQQQQTASTSQVTTISSSKQRLHHKSPPSAAASTSQVTTISSSKSKKCLSVPLRQEWPCQQSSSIVMSQQARAKDQINSRCCYSQTDRERETGWSRRWQWAGNYQRLTTVVTSWV